MIKGGFSLNKYVRRYVALVDFLADALGTNTEVVLHDLTDWSCSVAAIRNGEISGRKIGSPISDLALKILKETEHTPASYITNHEGFGSNGATLKSSTFFIRDDKGNPVGMLCLNFNYDAIIQAKEALDLLVSQMNISMATSEAYPREYLPADVKHLIESQIRNIYPDYTQKGYGLSKADKIHIVSRLNDEGTFLMKGAVGIVSEYIGVSSPTIYRYLSILKEE